MVMRALYHVFTTELWQIRSAVIGFVVKFYRCEISAFCFGIHINENWFYRFYEHDSVQHIWNIVLTNGI